MYEPMHSRDNKNLVCSTFNMVKDGENHVLPVFFHDGSLRIPEVRVDLEKPVLNMDDINGAFNHIRVAFESSDEYDSELCDYLFMLLRHKSMKATLPFFSNLPFVVCLYFVYMGELDVLKEFHALGFFNRHRRTVYPTTEVYLSGRYVCLDLIAKAAYRYNHNEILKFQLEHSLFNFNRKKDGYDHGVSDEIGMHLLKLALEDPSSKLIRSMLPAGNKVLQYRTTRINVAIDRMRGVNIQSQQGVHKFLSLFTNATCMANLCSTLLQHLSPENKSYVCYGTYIALALHQKLSRDEKFQLIGTLADKKVVISDPLDCAVLIKTFLTMGDNKMMKLVMNSVPCNSPAYDDVKEQVDQMIVDTSCRPQQLVGLIVKNHFTVKTRSDIHGQAMINGFSGLSGFDSMSGDFAMDNKFSSLASGPPTAAA